ncbi:hypothetical protein [Mesorhizobium sp. SP-1A]|uniref:hypothetical protein n=1 Tax=Mesorhizobium sp. SP-1A TaxID=3077840 RepID=UPI0028F70BBC|nr:hypothetical protein [Mesorhizobium sp. SP-1A]
MNEFYDAILSVISKGMLTGVVTIFLLIAVLAYIQYRDIKRYPAGDRGSRIAMAVSVYFYALAFTFYSGGKRDLVIAAEACPIAQRVLTEGVGVAGLEFNHRQAIVDTCGVKFFERYSGIKWKGPKP